MVLEILLEARLRGEYEPVYLGRHLARFFNFFDLCQQQMTLLMAMK